ncbi:ABC transporter permease [Pseudomonas protegens]|uniref:ABC transporter permease n=1 Tax=Pseudomonas protegens TaxID=380021 RepID=UPI00274F9D61|nr:ABC transporter permease [Pseudomonas protegens]MDP9530034.1 ABC transporter permease [Pseudomonas protegens]
MSGTLDCLKREIFSNKKLIFKMTCRDISARYRGSVLGFMWAIIQPLTLLGIYTFVFGVVFKSKWAAAQGTHVEFAVVLFIGLIIFNFFSESVSKSPWTISANHNFVKKVVFPVSTLPVITVLSSGFNFLMGLAAWFFIFFISGGELTETVFYFPLIIPPILLFSLSGAWVTSALGVYFKDLGQFIGLLMMMLMFGSPIFYPIAAIPEKYQNIMMLNPISAIIETARDVLIFNTAPSLAVLIKLYAGSTVLAYLGLAFFNNARKGFADVV